jgi:hypothetical protein
MQKIPTPLKMPRRRLLSPFHFMMIVIVGWSVLSGCDDGGGDNNRPTPTGTASGKLTVPPDNTVEVEPNDAPAQAQAASDSLTISGAASINDPGSLLPIPNEAPLNVPDLFRLETTEPVRITLSIGANDLDANDLDLILMETAWRG